MKRMKAWQVYLDDGYDAIKVIVPAATKKEAEDYCNGNGEVIAVREERGVFEDGTLISTNRLAADLRAAGWGDMEIMLITRTLERATEFAATT